MALDLLDQILPSLKAAIYPKQIPLTEWSMKEGVIPESVIAKQSEKGWATVQLPFQPDKFDKPFWFAHSVSVPEKFAGLPITFIVRNFDGLLYVNGKLFSGVDQFHHEFLLTQKSKANEKYFITLKTFNRKKLDHALFDSASLAVFDSTARHLFYGLTILREMEKLFDGSPEEKEIHELIRKTLIFLKYFRPDGEEYPNAIKRAYNFMTTTLDAELKSSMQGKIHLIGNPRFYESWPLTSEQTARGFSKTTATILRLMDEYPEFTCIAPSPYILNTLKHEHPDLYRQIKQRISEGRIEPACSMWADAHCNLPNGESLIRQILYGKKFLKNEFNIDAAIAWLPETNGFSWSLPQLFKKSGIDYFYTSVLNANDTNAFPYTSFWWTGIDGTKILSYHSPVGSQGTISPACLLNNIDEENNTASVPVSLQPFGRLEQNGGISEEQLEYHSVLKSILSLPPSSFSSSREFYRHLEQQSEELPIWNNELYLEAERGTYTTQSKIKKITRELEIQLQRTELLYTLCLLYAQKPADRKYPTQQLGELWQQLMHYQSHTILSGTAPSVVYDAIEHEYTDTTSKINSILTQALQKLTTPVKKNPKEFSFTIFNTLGWERNEYQTIRIPASFKHWQIVDDAGHIIDSQIIDRDEHDLHVLCFFEHIPAFGNKSYTVTNVLHAAHHSNQWHTTSHSIETPYYKFQLDKKGRISSLYARHLKRDLIVKGKAGNLFQTFQDTPKEWEARELSIDYEKFPIDLCHLKQTRIIEEGPLRATLRLDFKTDNGSSIVQHMHLYHKSPRIDFTTHIKWKERQTLLKVAFPFNIKSRNGAFEIPFGVLQRPAKPINTIDRAKFEVPALQWADMSETKCGVSLFNDCKYGYDLKDNTIRLTLLRSPHTPNINDPAKSDSAAIDLGEHTFTYALYPHTGTWMEGLSQQRATEFNNQLLVLPHAVSTAIPSIITRSKHNIIIHSIKKAEDSNDIIIRMYESHGSATETVLHFGIAASRAIECDLLERDLKPWPIKKSKVSIKFKPFEIKTIKVSAAPIKRGR